MSQGHRTSIARDAGAGKWVLIGLAAAVLGGVLIAPMVVVFYYALADGWKAYLDSVTDKATWSAVKLTLITAAIAVPLNTVFGVAAAWCVTRYRFRGRSALVTLLDLPLAVSPVVAGLALVAMFHRQSAMGKFLEAHDMKVIFALPGMVMATVFITFPFVARELIPLMESQGTEEEEAAHSLGASGWQIFWRVTLPNIKWAVLYGAILCNARAVGEFGAVAAVTSGQEEMMTLPLRINDLYHRNLTNVSAPFAVATLLTLAGLATLLLKVLLERKSKRENKS